MHVKLIFKVLGGTGTALNLVSQTYLLEGFSFLLSANMWVWLDMLKDVLHCLIISAFGVKTIPALIDSSLLLYSTSVSSRTLCFDRPNSKIPT